ncbi:uncharacterized protein KY384_001813 [Bacidia gigantensis]|uniref:uncharacterized protein n=1 Tax=Bacidia gigantensis TaxID=2732470 RepID=UPI001D0368D5|nr:uncharacterized protein KY384_001813 [Bacidia gigantensis]KAG8533030.1 hypothetical protein KY384_001813 [Bacidia gigantensis]
MGPLPPTVQGPRYLTGDVQYMNDVDPPDPITYTQKDWKWFELPYNGRVLKYTVAISGRQPATGYPMFIGLCGGGTDNDPPGLRNTGSWIDASTRYFSIPVQDQTKAGGVFTTEGAVLVVPRGVSELNNTDSYFLHSEPESYVLIEALIADLLQKQPQPVFDNAQKTSTQFNDAAPSLIDPDRVFLTGYSAGGNGVFQLSQRILERFAAVNAGAGHPEGTNFKNLANLPISLQVGELDNYQDGNRVSHSRSQVYVKASFDMDTLQNNGVYYIHKCDVVQGQKHEGPWDQPPPVGNSDAPQSVLSDLHDWYADSTHTTVKARAVTSLNINPFRWFMNPNNVTGFKRTTDPNWVVWDLGTRPPKPDGVDKALQLSKPGWQPKRFSYWLYLRDANADEVTIEAEYSRGPTSNWIDFKTPQPYVVILLREDMVDYTKKVDVHVGGQPTGVSFTLTANQTIRAETLAARNDPHLVYSAAVYLDQNPNKTWVPRLATSLATIDVAYTPAAEL